MAGTLVSVWPEQPEPAGSTDARLVRRFLDGDAAAFEQIIALHQRPVARLAQRLLGWPADVDDVVQEVFLAAMQHMHHFRGDCRLSTWLAGITVNKCRSARRRRLLKERVLRRYRSEGPVSGRGAAPCDEAEERGGEVRRAIADLPARYREVVVLRYLEELPIEEIARALALRKNTVEVRLHRARARLKGALGRFLEGDSHGR